MTVLSLPSFDLRLDWGFTHWSVPVACAVVGVGLVYIGLGRVAENDDMNTLPGPTGWPGLGNVPEILPYLYSQKLHEYFLKQGRKYGRIYRFKVPGRSIVVVSDAAEAKRILTSTEFAKSDRFREVARGVIDHALFALPTNDTWKRHRKWIQPAFGPIHLRETIKASSESVDQIISSFNQLIHEKKDNDKMMVVVDIYKYCVAVALDVLGKIAFSYHFGCVESVMKGDSVRGVRDIQEVFGILMTRFFVPKWAWGMVGVGHESQRVKEAKIGIEGVLRDMIRERRELRDQIKLNPNSKKDIKSDSDLLDRLLDTQSDPDGFTDLEIQGEVFGFFLAGHETTANTLTLIFMNLCEHPHVMDKLMDEIDKVFMKHGGMITMETLHEYRYLEWCIRETQRKYSIVRSMTRTSVKDVMVMGRQFKKGTVFQVDLVNLGMDMEYWKNPNEFIPERWDMDTKLGDVVIPGSFMPFGDGPHNCVGQKMSLVEMRVVLIGILRKFRVRKCEGFNAEFVTAGTFGLKKGYLMCVEKRNDV